MHLKDLPQFSVDAIHEQDGEIRFDGRLSHLRGVRVGRSWLYAGVDSSIIGDLESLDSTTGRAAFITPDRGLADQVAINASFPWIDAYWQSYHVAMIADPGHSWMRTVFVPGPARHFTLGGVHGWQPVDALLPDGATDLGVRPGDWDHEHCEICQAKIGRGGTDTGFRDPVDHWLCQGCHDRYAVTHDLSFLTDA